MIEFTARQGQNRHFQLRQFVVLKGWFAAQTAAEFAVEVVFL